MTFDLIQHVKARTRSVHFDKGTFSLTTASPVESSAKTSNDSRRASSLPVGHENQPPSPDSSDVTVQQYRSMLDVEAEEPPTLSPMNPMSFDELYVDPTQSADWNQPRPSTIGTKNIARLTLGAGQRTADSSSQNSSCLYIWQNIYASFSSSLANISINSFSRQRIPSSGPFGLAP